MGLLSRIDDMTSVQAHRGPDGQGYVLIGKHARFNDKEAPAPVEGDCLALGHRRLAIIDRTAGGAQPKSSFDAVDWISYNGEVYNYLELREELRSAGVQFRGESDTEVVLAAYQAWGLDCFARFNGMWGLALWDGRRRRLILSRDRLGVKPLYYAQTAKGLIFASEIKGILASGEIFPTLDRSVAIDYLKWSLVNHRNESFFQGIRSLPPGHVAVIEDAAAEVKPEPFWTLRTTDESDSMTKEDASARFSELFRDAVSLRMRSDVPVGSCLSGGLDSSAIVCQADALRASNAGPLHTFNSASNDSRFDERHWCDVVNHRVGADAHHVFPEAGGFKAELDDLIWHQEEPFTSASIYAQWAIMHDARLNSIPVLLDGQGADEGLCGYRKFYLFHLTSLWRKRHFARLFSELVALVAHGDRGMLRWREGMRYLPSFLRGRVTDLSTLLKPDVAAMWEGSRLKLGASGSIADRQIQDLTRFSVPSLLRYEDRNSMAWSIESRVPFLDYRLVEWLIRAPVEVKLASGRTKVVMRQALRGLVPDEVLDRRDKMGFVTAQEVWLRGPLRKVLEGCFSAPDFPLAAIVDPQKVLCEYRNWLAGRPSVGHQEFFRLFILARWVKRFGVRV